MSIELDASEVTAFAADLRREHTVAVVRRTNNAVGQGIDHAFTAAISVAEGMRDTGDMIAATHKVGRGYSRAIYCDDPAGMMNEFGNHGRPPRPWLLVQGDPAIGIVETEMARDLGEFRR